MQQLKLNKFLSLFIYNDRKHSNINGIKFLIRFVLIPLILAPILYPHMLINKRKYNQYYIQLIQSYKSMKEWLSKYEFAPVKDRYVKTDTITQDNPMYYESDFDNKLTIQSDVSKLLINQLTSINAYQLIELTKVNVIVSSDYVSELDLLNNIYDAKIKADTIKELMVSKNVETESELMMLLNLSIKDIKIILYTVSIEYKYIKTLRNLLIYFLINVCFIASLIIFLSFIK